MVIFKRQVPACGIAGYYWVYFVEEDGQEVEIGRTVWNDWNTLLEAANVYEDALLDAFKFFREDTNIEIITV